MISLISNFFKADIRQKSLLFWDWFFPFLLMIGVVVFIGDNPHKTEILGGLIAFLMMQSLIFAIPFRLTEYKNKGILQLVVEEGNVRKFVGVFLITRALIVLMQCVIFLPFGAIMLKAQLSINFLKLLIVLFVGLLVLGGISLFIGVLCKTQQGALGAAQVGYLLLTATSGVFYPLDKSPEILRLLSRFSPLTYLNKLLGYSLMDKSLNINNILGLVVVGISIVTITVVIFSKKNNKRYVY